MSGLVTVGETLALVSAGPLAHATTAGVGIGGAESNVAIGVRRLGAPATWIGRVGRDSLGSRVLRELRAEDVTVLAQADETAPTALMVKETTSPGRARVWYYRDGSAGSRLRPEDLPAAALAAADVLHLTGITPGLSDTARAATHAALDLAGARTVVAFDVNHRARVWGDRDAAAVYRDLAARADVVFAGEDEARLLTGTPTTDPYALLAELAETTAGDVVLKRGAAGCVARLAATTYDVPAVPVPVVDTVGAGDAFVAGYLAELLGGRPPEERLRTAVRCGAFACLAPGDWEGLPSRPDLDTLDHSDPVVR
ncbi:sugar kinase [Nocardioides mangrovi]|uniref:Sugar kinase n=1 Tax=Nocardioides mangrovi TaxID=2874580 RepID=A0ABS7UJL7_9ACTN|nr:sugar kinase [Nocardioides mangrovi]MBZ5740972.1 sugar kinase [Nocardioides mangrovi]